MSQYKAAAATMPFALGSDGYFRHFGKPYYPAGVNYWPASCGVELWRVWPEREIRADLELLARLGLNTLRFFLLWRDFEPARGQYEMAMWRRLEHLLDWVGETGLSAQPTLLVGGMSGGLIWPEWKTGSVFSDPGTVDAFAGFAREVTRVLRDHAEVIQAVDFGNEICNLPDSRGLSHDLIGNWCRRMCGVVRIELPGVPLTIGNEQSQVLYDGPWRLDGQGPLDFLCMHGYPVPGWHSVPFDGMTDPVGQQLLPSYTRLARRFGPVMVQEFGSILTAGAAEQEAYFRAVLPRCAAAGANGFLWWCFRDITAAIEPYESVGMEKRLGLVDASGRIKHGLEGVLEFLQAFARSGPAPTRPATEVHLLLPDPYYSNPTWSRGNRPERHAPRLVAAEAMLRAIGLNVDFCTPQALPNAGVVYNPGCVLSESQAATVRRWIEDGGRYATSGILWNSWGPEHSALFGGDPVDLQRAGWMDIEWATAPHRLIAPDPWPVVRLAPAGFRTLATCGEKPSAWSARLGHGEARICLPSLEETWLAHQRVCTQPAELSGLLEALLSFDLRNPL